jgi:aryl-alcohol dehydrogenase-like predicted oxidoreductase
MALLKAPNQYAGQAPGYQERTMSDMTFRSLGTSGLQVSLVGIGCNNFGSRMSEEAVAEVVSVALDAGINLFDTAAAYTGSEERLGKALGSRREEAIIATKFPSPYEHSEQGGGSRHHVIAACEGSLRRLGVDYIDLYQMHNPDPTTPIEETLAALDGLVRQGKVRYLGNCNFSGWQIADADWTARTDGLVQMVSAQNNYSLVNREVEREVAPACLKFGLGILPYFPLASGLLTGKYRRGDPGPEGARLSEGMPLAGLASMFLTDANFDIVDSLEKVATDNGVTLLHLAMSGLAAQPAVASIIAGATSSAQVTANARAGTWVPPQEVLEAINTAAPGPGTT